MMRYLSFLGISFIFAILFGFVNHIHLKHEESQPGSLLANFLLILKLLLSLLGLPVIILSYPVLTLSERRLEDLYKRQLSIKYDMLLNTYKQQLEQADRQITDLKEQIWDERLTKHKEEYMSGQRSGFRNGFKAGFFACYDISNLPNDEKWSSMVNAWDSVELNVRMCEDSSDLDC